MRYICALAFAASLLITGHAQAWNARGHMMVAAVAWELLDEETQQAASELLKLNPHHHLWVKDVPKNERDKTAFMKAAVWPDFIRGLVNDSDDPYIDDGSDPEKAEDANRNSGYDDKNLHRYWHFVDLPFSRDGTPLQQPKAPNALTQIIKFRDTLRSNADDEVKSYDLVWLLHLVGDVHQPLHATARFSSLSPDGDRGGNDVKLCASPCRNNLHSFWDSGVGTGDSINAIIKAADNLEEAALADVAKTDPKRWIDESFETAKKFVYRTPIGATNGPFTITDAYKKRTRSVSEERVALGGARLAKLLNENLHVNEAATAKTESNRGLLKR